MKSSLKDIILNINPPDLSIYKKNVPLFIKEAMTGANWDKWDKAILKSYLEDAKNGVAYLGQGCFRPEHKSAIKENWMKLAPHLKAIAQSQDVPLWKEYEAVKRIVIDCTKRNMQIATNRMLASLQPKLLCTEVDLKKVNELYDYIRLYTNTEIPQYDKNNWERASHELLNLFHTLVPGKNSLDYAYMPWKLLEYFRKLKMKEHNTYWLISSNDRIFRLADCLKENKYVDWRGSFSPRVGDVVFIYRSIPIQRICYKMIVTKINIPYRDTFDDSKYCTDKHPRKEEIDPKSLYHRLCLQDETNSMGLHLKRLKEHGMKGVPQSPRRLSGELLDYILSFFNYEQNDYDEIADSAGYYEGALKRICVNSYERDQDAREKCIKVHGCRCAVCGLDFEKMYGELGKDFIHVHHKIPISTIKAEYKVDPINDLIPVCPNCHAMLHRGKRETLSIDDLKEIVQINNERNHFANKSTKLNTTAG